MELVGGGVSVHRSARSPPRLKRGRLIDSRRAPHPLDRIVARHEVDVVEVRQQGVDEAQESVEVLGTGRQPVWVQVDAERRAGGPVEAAEVVPEVGEGVAESASLRLGGRLARVHHRARPTRPVNVMSTILNTATPATVLTTVGHLCIGRRSP